MTFTIGRRGLLLAGAAFAAAGALRPAFAQENRLRLIFWGSKDRADRTFAVADAYEKANGVTIAGITPVTEWISNGIGKAPGAAAAQAAASCSSIRWQAA